MKKILISTLLLLFAYVGFSQTGSHVSYTYDDAGNRETRVTTVIVMGENLEKNMIEELEEYKNVFAEGSILIAPNPTKGVLHIHFQDIEITDKMTYRVFDIKGREVLNKQIRSNKEQVDLSKEASGIYFLKIKTDNDTIEYKIIKE